MRVESRPREAKTFYAPRRGEIFCTAAGTLSTRRVSSREEAGSGPLRRRRRAS